MPINALKYNLIPAEDDLPEWNERMNATIGQSIPLRVEYVSKQRVVVGMTVTPRTHQPFGILHGGVSLLLAESAASIGANCTAPAGMMAVGQEINANHLRAKRGGELTATATPVHVGRASQVWSVEIRDENGRMICVSRCTLANVPARPAPSTGSRGIER